MANENGSSENQTGALRREVESLNARLDVLETPPPVPFWKSMGGIAIITAVIALAAPITAAVSGQLTLMVEERAATQELALKRLELDSKVQGDFVTKAMAEDDDERRSSVLRFLALQQDPTLREWASVEFQMARERVKDEATVQLPEAKRAAESARSEVERLEVAAKNATNDDSLRAELAGAKRQLAETKTIEAKLQATAKSRHVLRLSTLHCINAETFGGKLDEIRVVVDTRTLWEGMTCGKKDGSEGRQRIDLDLDVELFQGCAQISILELDGLSNDSLGMRTVCATDRARELTFRGTHGLSDFEYRADYEIREIEFSDG